MQEEIILQNKVIAEFMGWEFREVAMGIEFWKENECRFLESKEYLPRHLIALRYHSDWSWIMPAWIKFRKLAIPGEQYFHIRQRLEYFLCSSDEPGRLAKELFQAIEWYNKQKEETNEPANS